MRSRSITLHSTMFLSTTPDGSCATRKSARMSTPAGSAAGAPGKGGLFDEKRGILGTGKRQLWPPPAFVLGADVPCHIHLLLLRNPPGHHIPSARPAIL